MYGCELEGAWARNVRAMGGGDGCYRRTRSDMIDLQKLCILSLSDQSISYRGWHVVIRMRQYSLLCCTDFCAASLCHSSPALVIFPRAPGLIEQRLAQRTQQASPLGLLRCCGRGVGGASSRELRLEDVRLKLGRLSGVRDGRVDERTDRVGQLSGLDAEGVGQVDDLRLDVCVSLRGGAGHGGVCAGGGGGRGGLCVS